MSTNRGVVWSTSSEDFSSSVQTLFTSAKLQQRLQSEKKIILKPNLIEASKPPITTPVELIESIVTWLRYTNSHLEIVIAEGNGVPEYDTFHCFDVLGYTQLAKQYDVELIDLNIATYKSLQNSSCKRLPEIELPEVIFDGFLLSVPVLKAHSMSKVTLTMKNMMGCAPQSGGAGWRKSQLHHKLHEAIFDLNQYRTPDFSVIDASIGMAQAHLWGPACEPPVGKVLASYDPVAIDAYGTELLGKKWQDIKHINMAHEVLGSAEPLNIQEI